MNNTVPCPKCGYNQPVGKETCSDCGCDLRPEAQLRREQSSKFRSFVVTIFVLIVGVACIGLAFLYSACSHSHGF